MEHFSWVNWSEVNREELNKKRIFEEFIKTGTLSTEDQEFCDKIDWYPVDELELKEEYIAVTVLAGQTLGTGTATSDSTIIGWRPIGNQDQFIDNIAISGTTITITLSAAATANNTFEVILLKS